MCKPDVLCVWIRKFFFKVQRRFILWGVCRTRVAQYESANIALEMSRCPWFYGIELRNLQMSQTEFTQKNSKYT